VWANYVYLDTEERRRFAQKGHEYLIEQVQHTGGDQLATTGTEGSVQLIRLSFNHPVKELVWCYTNPAASASAQLNAMWNFCTATGNVNVTSNVLAFQATNNYLAPNATGVPHLVSTAGAVAATFGLGNNVFSGNAYWIEQGTQVLGGTAPGIEVGPLHLFKVILNGQDRFKEQYGNYFNQVQPFYHHTGTPYPGIYTYSFALQPEEHQPTGTCNFSRIDNAQVSVQMKSNNAATLQKLFAVNYNILRIQSGMGGLAFSN
jgi:hypothetical protein